MINGTINCYFCSISICGTTKLLTTDDDDDDDSDNVKRFGVLAQLMWSYRLKQLCFLLIICSTAGLVYYFLQHRWFCEAGG